MVKNGGFAIRFVFFPFATQSFMNRNSRLGHSCGHVHYQSPKAVCGQNKGQRVECVKEPKREGAHVLIEFLAEGLALSRALAQDLQGSLGRAEGPHAVMDPARPQPALGNLKAPALTWLERKTGTADSMIPS